MSHPEATLDQRLAKALSHPLRMQLLTLLNQRVASPVELASELGARLGNVSYHVRILLDLGCIELVSTTPRRGALEHHYRALQRPILGAEDWAEIPLSVRREIADGLLTQIAKDIGVAGKRGGFDRSDVHLTRTPLVLDEEGWEEVGERMQDVLDRALEIQAESAERVIQRHAQGDPAADTFAANLVMLLFEQPPPQRKRRPG